MDVDALLFGVPEVPVFLIAGEKLRDGCSPGSGSGRGSAYPPRNGDGLGPVIDRLRVEEGIRADFGDWRTRSPPRGSSTRDWRRTSI